jgi:protein-S-isoprenylcysteine O-methyltransferase Ste14
MVLLVIPAILIRASGGVNPGWGLPLPWSAATTATGAVLVVTGLSLMARTIGLIGAVGRGTLAPWDPTRRLVVRGACVRTMISGVFCVLLGEAVLLGSTAILGWFACFAILNMTFIPLAEEPDLLRRFGEDYRVYRQNVPRWIPRRTPWRPHWDDA